MYTIIIDDNNNLTTSVRTNLLCHTTTDEIQILYKPNLEEVIPEKFQAILYYREGDGIAELENLQTDAELYKDRVRFYIPAGAAFFDNRGELEVWVEVNYFEEWMRKRARQQEMLSNSLLAPLLFLSKKFRTMLRRDVKVTCLYLKVSSS